MPLSHNPAGHKGSSVIGTDHADTIHGGTGVVDIRGWAGDDLLFGGVRGGLISGGRGNDTIYTFGFGAPLSQQFQTHAYGDWGNDTFYLGMARYNYDTYANRFGHHVFGGHGADRFIFSRVAQGDQKITGRIDDFDPTQDSIWIENVRVNLNDLPDNVRIVQHLGQQWILIDNRILYALEGARHASSTVQSDGRNSESSEENHFIYWPEEWADGVPASADVVYRNPVNFIPARFLPVEAQYEHRFSPRDHSFSGTARNDRIEGSPDHGQNLFGLGGHDFIFGNRGDDTIQGGEGNDYIDGYHGHDRIFGGSGNDSVDGGKGHDIIVGGLGHDVIAGGSDNDTLHGAFGDDTIFGGSENDLIFGDSGNDALHGGSGNDRLNGGVGADILDGGDGHDRLWGGVGNDRMLGGLGNDWLHGGDGHDHLYGGWGNDTVSGHHGNDLIFGGQGNDRMFGNSGNDHLYGDAGDDHLDGGYGNDILVGGVGRDTIAGGAGTDRLHGGAGADRFVFFTQNDSRPGQGRDVIVDFTPGEDKIDLSRLDADLSRAGNQALIFNPNGPAEHAVWLIREESGISVRADLDGDGVQDFAVWLAGVQRIVASDFIL